MTPLLLGWLIFTVPSTNAYVEGDSVYMCQEGSPTSDLAWIRFWRQDVTGGMPYPFDSLYVRGMEGLEDSIEVDPGAGAHFYAQPVNTAGGAGCFSEPVYLPGYVTGVGDMDVIDPPVDRKLFDVNGRLVTEMMATGIYFEQVIRRSGRIEKGTMLRIGGKTIKLRR